jgi:hypothetical protein
LKNDKIHIGMFGDSYASLSSTWIQYLRQLDHRYQIDVHGKGGANLYYAIHQWLTMVDEKTDHYDWVFFTLTWPERLFSVWPYRNEQFCARSEFRTWEPDCSIQTDQDNREFLQAIDLYQKYIHDWHWRQFDYELEIRWIMELPKRHPEVNFVIIPNTEESKVIALRHHTQGILLDMAFETISNLEPNSPGPMPVQDKDRSAHLNDANHRAFADLAHEIMRDHGTTPDKILPVDLKRFDVRFNA